MDWVGYLLPPVLLCFLKRCYDKEEFEGVDLFSYKTLFFVPLKFRIIRVHIYRGIKQRKSP